MVDMTPTRSKRQLLLLRLQAPLGVGWMQSTPFPSAFSISFSALSSTDPKTASTSAGSIVPSQLAPTQAGKCLVSTVNPPGMGIPSNDPVHLSPTSRSTILPPCAVHAVCNSVAESKVERSAEQDRLKMLQKSEKFCKTSVASDCKPDTAADTSELVLRTADSAVHEPSSSCESACCGCSKQRTAIKTKRVIIIFIIVEYEVL